MSVKAVEMNLATARSLGLALENLVSFRVDFRPAALPIVTATYFVTDPKALECLQQEFELQPVVRFHKE